jgi:hypothetical protein
MTDLIVLKKHMVGTPKLALKAARCLLVVTRAGMYLIGLGIKLLTLNFCIVLIQLAQDEQLAGHDLLSLPHVHLGRF